VEGLLVTEFGQLQRFYRFPTADCIYADALYSETRNTTLDTIEMKMMGRLLLRENGADGIGGYDAASIIN
jgi:hypothetical protein